VEVGGYKEKYGTRDEAAPHKKKKALRKTAGIGSPTTPAERIPPCYQKNPTGWHPFLLKDYVARRAKVSIKKFSGPDQATKASKTDANELKSRRRSPSCTNPMQKHR
jgi:hypothetical protein